jgi:thiol-disulfide isomerase/thioredoxin
MKLVHSLMLAMSLTAITLAAPDPHPANIPAPALELQEVLQGPHDPVTWPSLRGKVVVLEFWATWCPSCVKMMPHLNELADQLNGQPVVFISITDEKPEVVRAFLEKTKIRGWVGLNTTSSMFASYGIDHGRPMAAGDTGRPMTVVVRPDGIIDARIRPWVPSLTVESLKNLAAGKPSGLVNTTAIFAGEVHDQDGKPLPNVTAWLTNARFQLDTVKTGENGRFAIDSDDPLSFINESPVRLTFKRKDFADEFLEDLRLFPPQQQANLHITLRTKPATRWSEMPK